MRPLSTRSGFWLYFVLASLGVFLVPCLLSAATYIVPPDAEMIQRSDDIVVATGITSTVERTPRGGIVTRYVLRIEEVLKGQRSRGSHLILTEIGGQLPDLGLYVSGMPVYEPGERYVVFTDANRDGEPRTFGLELGQFVLRQDESGRLLAHRNASGMNQNLDSFSERARDAKGFVDYIRGIVAQRVDPEPKYFVAAQTKNIIPHEIIGIRDFTRRSYLLTGAPRWESTPNARLKSALTPSGADGVAAINDAYPQWNGTASNIDYAYSSRDDTLTSGFTAHDGEDVVLFGDPNGEVDPPVLGRGGYWTSNALPYSFGGETFKAIDGGVDVVLDNTTFSQCLLNVVMVHELGHTLGFRHSNQNGDSGTNPPPCSPSTQDCTGTAIMNSAVGCSLTILQTWDQTAAAVVYGAGPQCTPPSISPSGQPASQSITSGNSANLSVVASGSTPFTYQWYIGTSGNTSQPTGSNSSSLNVSPTTTTSYWVRVTGQCAPTVDSNTATVTVNQPTCTPPSISGQPQSQSITAGNSTSLSVSASGTAPFSYQWYIGTSGNTSQPTGANSSSLNVSPATTTSYWVRVTGQCAPAVDSNTATITVTADTCPEVNVQSPSAAKQTNGSYLLDVVATSAGGSLTYQWFQGAVPGVGTQIGTGRPFSVLAPTAPISYWVRVFNNCNKSANSPTVVTIAPCDLPVIGTEPGNQSIANGASATLTVAFTSATGATVRWYRGTAPNKTTEVGVGASFNTGALTATTQFWASITNSCGEKFTRTATITVGSACTPPAILTTSTAQTKLKGETVTLNVNASGTAPLHYQWYEGVPGDISHPVGTDASSFTSAPLTATTKFWVRVTNTCSNAPSGAIVVTVIVPRSRAVRH